MAMLFRDELSLSGITQYYIDTASEEWKFETLTDIFASICVPQTVIFVNTRHKADWLSGRLCVDGFTATAAHGDLDQATRDRVMNAFRADSPFYRSSGKSNDLTLGSCTSFEWHDLSNKMPNSMG
ncbi:ATP-dependent RNA helicase eIF4A [Echinococcus granulosus]|uniref:ATP-dependent RNA helicase eIF4A n=1 Tax=Echinococcus granulosus TaxID=6210 RepID=W6UV49_ECHGR|nr:ATP-dependent RNA helicase eIF4A [Echinococcus granulosus]EUB57319.1 ATP-dependent RNA helicase eIF4A [Echinococcus granulosus]